MYLSVGVTTTPCSPTVFQQHRRSSSSSSDDDEQDGGRSEAVPPDQSTPIRKSPDLSDEGTNSIPGSPLLCEVAEGPSDLMDGFFSRALAFTDELSRSLPTPPEDPPGRLPVSLTPAAADGSIRMNIDLKAGTSSIIRSGEVPLSTGGFPTLELSERGVRAWFDQACSHLSYFAGKLMEVMTSGTDGGLLSEDYALAFRVFKEEFEASDEVVSFALKRVGMLVEPGVAKGLDERHRNVKNMFWKLEFASFNGRLYHQEDSLSQVTTDIGNFQRLLFSLYA